MQLIFSSVEEATFQFANRLSDELKEKKVLWLLSGGSNIPISINVMRSLSSEKSRNLSIMPIDERFGPPGHKDSNWFQLISSGLNPLNSNVIIPLISDQSLLQASERFNELAARAFSAADLVIGQIGMGSDGHIAGIMPGSIACQATEKMVVNYEAAQYHRLTLSLKALSKVDAAYCFVFGENKRSALQSLIEQNLSVSAQPVQFLKQLNEVYLYNDQIKED